MDKHHTTVQTLEAELQSLRAAHDALQTTSTAATAELEKKHADTLQELRTQHEEEKRALQEQVTADVQTKVDSAWTQLTAEHAEEKKQQAEAHAQAVQALEQVKAELQQQLDASLAENAKLQSQSEVRKKVEEKKEAPRREDCIRGSWAD